MTKTDWTEKILDNKYKLVSLIGEGGMGVVYEAQHELIRRRLAVKFLHSQYTTNDEAVVRFQREAQAAAKIGHENIIEITDMGKTEDDGPYIVMEFLEGTDVQGIIETEGPLSVERTARIMVQALSALQAAHNVQIIHRDLKPENIFLTRKFSTPDFVKLLDFGISKFRALETDGQKPLTQTGAVLGTPQYMSPEQAMGHQMLTPQSDIYSMGVIMYQMLTGHLPFNAPNYNALLMKILTEEPAAPETLNPYLPDDIAVTIKTAMARNPEDRFVDCEAFRKQLLSYVPEIAVAPGSQVALNSGRLTAVKKTQTATTTPLEMAQSGIARPRNKLPLSMAAVAAVLLAIIVGIVAGIVAIASGGKTSASPRKSQHIQVAAPRSDRQVVSNMVKKAEALSEQVTLSVHVQPESASIYIDGAAVENPYNGKFVKSDVNRLIVITAPGHVGVSELVTFNRDMNLSFKLREAPVKEVETKKKKKWYRVTPAEKQAKVTAANSASAEEMSEKKELPAARKNPRIIDKTNPWDD